MRKVLLLFGMLVLCTMLAFSQTKMVTGKVTNQQGQPIEGATIRIEGTKLGTTTNPNGEFRINVKDGNVLHVSSIGFLLQKIKIGSLSNYSVILPAHLNPMDEVVVTAGGLKSKRKEQGYNATLLKADELTLAKPVNVTAGLSGKVAGLMISDVSGGVNPNYRIVLRGQRSLLGNNQALIVLDNVVVPNAVLGNLNPDDIADIVVLNGASAVALYGSEASNGALIVTTKKGKKGVTQVKVSNTTTIQSIAFQPKLQNEFGAGGNGYGVNPDGTPVFSDLENQSYGPRFNGQMVNLGLPLEDGSQLTVPYSPNNSRFEFWEKGILNQTDFSATTGDDVSTLYLSGQYASVTGTTPGDRYNRATARLNGTRKIGSALSATYSLDYTQNRYNVTTAGASIYNNLLNIPANVPITSFKDWRNNKFANPNGFYNPWYQNPYFAADNNRQYTRNDYLIGNLQLDYNPLKWLNFTYRLGITTNNNSYNAVTGKFTYTAYAKTSSGGSKTDIPGSVYEDNDYNTRLTSDFLIGIKKHIKDFSFDLTMGNSIRQSASKYTQATVTGLVVPGLYNLSNSTNFPSAYSNRYQARQVGLYADFKIGFKNYLYLHATGRNDWVSILNPPNNSFFYPAADISFIATDAIPSLKNVNGLDFLKLRAGVSKVGQVNLTGDPNSTTYGAYSLLPIFTQASGYPFNGVAGYSVGNGLVQPNLLPEITTGWEAGFDMTLFKDFVNFSATWYNTHTNNQTVSAYVSWATGFSNYLLNSGEVSNKGLETKLALTPIKTKDWTVTVSGNYAYLNNEVLSINAQLPSLSIASYSNAFGSYAVPGHVFPVIMGNDYERDPQGHVIVDAITGLPQVNQTIKILGNASPKDQLGLDATVRYKHFSFYVLFEYRGGNQIYNAGGPTFDWSGMSIRTVAYNRQRFVFPNSVIADPNNAGKYIANKTVVVQNGNGNDGFWTDQTENMGVASNYVTSAAFWKLRQFSLSYDLPGSIFKSNNFIKKITISVQGRNLFIWLPKSNIYTDPEYSDAGNASNGIGLTNLQSPPSRYYGATLSVTF